VLRFGVKARELGGGFGVTIELIERRFSANLLLMARWLPAPHTVNQDQLIRWIQHPNLVAGDGRIMSWLDSESSGYPYDEATALYARVFAYCGQQKRAEHATEVMIQRLSKNGWLTRDRVAYAFDTAIALWSLPNPEPVVSRLVEWLTNEKVAEPITRPNWWSQSYGAHIIKSLVPIAECGRRRLAEALATNLTERCFDGERFRIHDQSQWTYLHSHCYAVEGLLGLGILSDVVRASADWMSTLFLPDGTLPTWVGGTEAPPQSDVLAQAIRIWVAVDRVHYDEAITRAMRALARFQEPVSGAMRYNTQSNHLNSWAGAFTLQAVKWVQKGVSPAELKWLF
jgi:hypothetical protein